MSTPKVFDLLADVPTPNATPTAAGKVDIEVPDLDALVAKLDQSNLAQNAPTLRAVKHTVDKEFVTTASEGTESIIVTTKVTYVDNAASSSASSSVSTPTFPTSAFATANVSLPLPPPTLSAPADPLPPPTLSAPQPVEHTPITTLAAAIAADEPVPALPTGVTPRVPASSSLVTACISATAKSAAAAVAKNPVYPTDRVPYIAMPATSVAAAPSAATPSASAAMQEEELPPTPPAPRGRQRFASSASSSSSSSFYASMRDYFREIKVVKENTHLTTHTSTPHTTPNVAMSKAKPAAAMTDAEISSLTLMPPLTLESAAVKLSALESRIANVCSFGASISAAMDSATAAVAPMVTPSSQSLFFSKLKNTHAPVRMQMSAASSTSISASTSTSTSANAAKMHVETESSHIIAHTLSVSAAKTKNTKANSAVPFVAVENSLFSYYVQEGMKKEKIKQDPNGKYNRKGQKYWLTEFSWKDGTIKRMDNAVSNGNKNRKEKIEQARSKKK